MILKNKVILAPTLAPLTLRLYNSVTNSVTSERSFSTMNFVHSKTRNRLSAEKVNKLVYIQINDLVLEDIKAQGKAQGQWQEKGQEDTEDSDSDNLDMFEIEHLEQRYMIERTTGQLDDQLDDQLDGQSDGQLVVAGTKRPFDATRDLE
jgi:uncharacterized protein (DUF4415 family)